MYNILFVVLVLKRHLRIHTQFDDDLANKLFLDQLKINSFKTTVDQLIIWKVNPSTLANLLDHCYDIVVKKHDPVLTKIIDDLSLIVEMYGYTIREAQYTTLCHKLKNNNFSYPESNKIQLRVHYYNKSSTFNYPYVLQKPPAPAPAPAPAQVTTTRPVIPIVSQPQTIPARPSLVPVAALPNTPRVQPKSKTACVIQ